MPLDLTDDESKLVQVMAWCHQATSHYLSQCWPSSMLPCGVIRPQWVDKFVLSIISQQWLCSYLMFFIIKDKNSLILHSQCQGCWWPGDTSSQGICSYGNDLIPHNILFSASKGLISPIETCLVLWKFSSGHLNDIEIWPLTCGDRVNLV